MIRFSANRNDPSFCRFLAESSDGVEEDSEDWDSDQSENYEEEEEIESGIEGEIEEKSGQINLENAT